MTAKGPTEDDLAGRLDELESKLVTREKVEEIAAGAALDVLKFYETEVKKATEAAKGLSRALEEREFARRVAASLGSRACRRKLDELMEHMDREELEEAVEAKAQETLSSRLESPEFAEKLREIAGGTEEAGALGEALQRQVLEAARGSVGDIVSSPEFKAVLDDKFKVLINYLTREVIPKQIRRMMGGG